MKTTLQKTVLMATLSAMFAMIFWEIKSQEITDVGYYREVYISKIDTLYSKPKSNRIILNTGVQYDAGLDAGPSAYLYARANVSRFLVSGLVSMLPGFPYNHQEGTLVFCFGGSSQRKSGEFAVTTDDGGTEQVRFKTGGKDKYVYAATVTDKTVNYYDKSGVSSGSVQLNSSTSKVTTTKTYNKNKKETSKSTAVLNVPKYTVSGLSVGAYHWQRDHPKPGTIDVVGFSGGLVASISKKAKYRFHWEERINDVEILGLGKYKQTPTGKIRKEGKRTASTNTSTDVGMEFLFAPVVKFENQQERIFAENDTIGTLKDLPKKRFGFRFRIERRSKIISMRYELGMRPGYKYKFENQEDNFIARSMTGMYLLVGFGIGIGAW